MTLRIRYANLLVFVLVSGCESKQLASLRSLGFVFFNLLIESYFRKALLRFMACFGNRVEQRDEVYTAAVHS